VDQAGFLSDLKRRRICVFGQAMCAENTNNLNFWRIGKERIRAWFMLMLIIGRLFMTSPISYFKIWNSDNQPLIYCPGKALPYAFTEAKTRKKTHPWGILTQSPILDDAELNLYFQQSAICREPREVDFFDGL
jgi:hypothetical protein